MAPSCVLLLALSFWGLAAYAQAAGQAFRQAEPELADLFDAAYAAQAKMFGAVAAIDASPDAREARDRFERSLRMEAEMSMAEMMAAMRLHAGMTMPGPFTTWEAPLRTEMLELLRTRRSGADVLNAYHGSPLPMGAIEVIRRGRLFENRVYDLMADSSVSEKGAALEDAAAMYLASESSVPARPKASRLLFDHPHAGAFFNGYPELSRLWWSTQWLGLAAIEAMIAQQEDGSSDGLETVRERFRSKIGSDGPVRSPAPVELPMAPAIAPRLFSLSPNTAVILDNLNMFETVVADVLSYPNVENKPAIVDSLVDAFTSQADNLDPTIDYLASALRGGIYNQGGPAVGELSHSERNRSRMEMGMRHPMVMPTP